MTEFLAKCTCWEVKLKNSSKKAKESINEIIQEIINEKNVITKSKKACKIFCIICTLVNEGYSYFKEYTNLIIKVLPYINQEHLENSILNRIRFYAYKLHNGKHWEELKAILEVAQYRKTSDEECIKYYFDLWKLNIRLIQFTKSTQHDNKICLENVCNVLNGARLFKLDLFLDFLDEVFDYINYLKIETDDIYQNFFESILENIEKITIIKNIEKLYQKLTKCLVAIIKIEVQRGKSLKNALRYLKVFIKCKNNEKQPCFLLLTIIFTFVKALNNSNEESFNSNFDIILKSLINITEKYDKDDLSAYTLTVILEIIFLTAARISIVIDLKNIQEILKYFRLLIKNLPNIQSNNFKCSYCNNYNLHLQLKIFEISIFIYKKFLKLNNMEDENISEIFSDISYKAIELYKEFNCKIVNTLYFNLFRTLSQTISKVNTKKEAQICLNIFNKAKSVKLKEEPISLSYSLYLYKKIYGLLNDHKNLMQACCVNVAHLLSISENEEKINYEIWLCCKLYENDKIKYNITIADMLDNIKIPLEVPKFNKKLINMLQFDVCLSYSVEFKLKEEIIKKIISMDLTDTEFAEVICKLDHKQLIQFLSKLPIDLEKKIIFLVNNLKNLTNTQKNCDKKIFFILGILQKILLTLECTKLKTIFSNRSITENNFDTIDCEIFNSINIAVENKIISIALESLKYFRILFEEYNILTENELYFEQIINSLSFIARHFNLRGYITYAYETWKLVYNIAIKIENDLGIIRSISFLTEYCTILTKNIQQFNLEQIIKESAPKIIKMFENIDNLTPRRQNYVLICILKIALYYLHVTKYDNYQLLVMMVIKKRQEIKSRGDDLDLINAFICALNFYVASVLPYSNTKNISPSAYASFVINNLKNIKNVTSEDSVNIPILLFKVIVDITHFSMNRLNSKSLKPYLYMLLKLSMEFGLSYRIIQILLLLAHLDLQAEDSKNCQKRLFIIDFILMKATKFPKTDTVEQLKKMNSTDITSLFLPYENLIEVTRRYTSARSPSPKCFKIPRGRSNCLMTDYLIKHKSNCACDICSNFNVQLSSFETGCLHARVFYLNGNHESAEQFFQNAFEWLKNLYIDNETKPTYNSLFLVLIYYVNILRKLEKFSIALDVCKFALQLIKKYETVFDIAPEQSFNEQITCIKHFMQNNDYVLKYQVKKANTTNKSIPSDKVKKCLIVDSENISVFKTEVKEIKTNIDDINLFNENDKNMITPLKKSLRSKAIQRQQKIKIEEKCISHLKINENSTNNEKQKSSKENEIEDVDVINLTMTENSRKTRQTRSRRIARLN